MRGLSRTLFTLNRLKLATMKDRFLYLLKRHVDGNASEGELEELRALLRSNQFGEAVKEDLAQAMRNDLEDPGPGPVIGLDADALYDRIMEEVREPFVKMEVNKKWSWIWAAAVTLIGLGLSFWMLKDWKNQDWGSAQGVIADSVLIFTNRDFIHLPDGSTVLLNEGSTLSYRSSYGKELREVNLSGEAYFDVKKDITCAFVVHAGDVDTRVLGTAFNVNARREKIVVTVDRGLVEVRDGYRTYGKVKPYEQITINTVNKEFIKEVVDVVSELEWKSQSLIFDGITIGESAKMIEERFNVKIEFENEAIRDCRIRAWFLNGEQLDHVLELVSGTRQATYQVQGGRVSIAGGIGCE